MVLDKFTEFHSLIVEHRNKIEQIQQERVEWCRANRDLVKSLFPKHGKKYRVIDNSLLYLSTIRQLDDLNEQYYFEPTPNQKFNPINHFRYFNAYPESKGTLLDCNLRKLDIGEVEVCVTNLEEVENVSKAKNRTNVYVMIDKNTGLYKIGRSVNPLARERTLQSEKPTIEMIFSASAMTTDEKVLHEMFADNRVRGEWFDLNGTQLSQVKEYLTCNNK